MRRGIRFKVGGFLILVLAIAFGLSAWIATSQNGRLLTQATTETQQAVEHAIRNQARSVFATLEAGLNQAMEDGEMENLQELIGDLGKIEGLLEIGLASPSGVINYNSRSERLKQKLDPAVFRAAAATKEVHETESADSLLLVRAKRLETRCLECHDQGKAGDVAGELFVRYSLAALQKAQTSGAGRLAASRRQGMRVGILTGVGGLLVASLGVYLLLGVQVCRPLDSLVARMLQMASGEADLTFRLPAEATDELGDVARAFNTFVENLQKLVAEVLGTTTDVAEGSDEILSASHTMLERATQQNERTQNAATAAEEMSATVMEVSRGTQEAADMARSATETAEAGSRVVEEEMGGMEKVQTCVKTIADKVRELGERSQAIGEVMQVIDDIADQTNLLALNAAIEAARAGEHGRGFAVVADEVRKLSEKTAQATRQVRDTVASIQLETEAAIGSVQQGLEEVAHSGELSRRTGEALRQIVEKIAKNAEMVTQIATATEQQSVAVADVSQGLESIAALSGELVSGVEQTGGTAERLGGQTQRLRDLVGRFKV